MYFKLFKSNSCILLLFSLKNKINIIKEISYDNKDRIVYAAHDV
jgi:hypothetical protein